MDNTITISAEDARELLSLYKAIKSADAVYKSCQAPQFREYVKLVYKAETVEGAYRRLQEASALFSDT